jgi:predicted GIY-YIG superfamily endonuclease
MWYVYVIKSRKTGYVYIGSTDNLKRRLTLHNNGGVTSTKPYYPFKLEAYIAVKSKDKARELERYFKMGSGKAVLKRRIL